VAAAGTHIYSRREGVGVIGNVYTRPDFRGRGLGTQVTGAVATHLLQRCELIVLNVDPANHAARHVYKQLGFHEAGSLIEAMSTRRAAYSPAPLLRRVVARHLFRDEGHRAVTQIVSTIARLCFATIKWPAMWRTRS
jgi:RimJ/RimL family protein N-acetyltransferase